MPRSLFARALLILLLPVLLLQGVVAATFIRRHYEGVTEQMASGVARELAYAVGLIETEGAAAAQARLSALALPLAMTLDFTPGAVVTGEARLRAVDLTGRVATDAFRRELQRPMSIDFAGPDRFVEARIQTAEGVLVARIERRRLVAANPHQLLVVTGIAATLLTVVAVIFLRNQVRPIRDLAAAADAFGKGWSLRFTPRGAEEVRRAGAAFLAMRARIERQIESRTLMLSGVSHDLRTPLTRMKLELAMLPPAPEVESLQADLAQMERMVEGYLAFARGEGSEAARSVDVGELLRHTVEEARRGGGRVDLHLEAALVSVVRPEALRRALTNLIANARRFGSSVAVTALRRSKGIEILIDDDGPGIAPEQREEVFRPFVRLERSRNFDTGGTGLGLTIARDMVRGQGGELTLHEAPGGGLRARLWLPG